MNDGREGLLYRVCFWLVSRDERACTTLRSGRVCARSAVSKGFRDTGRVGAWTCGTVALRGALPGGVARPVAARLQGLIPRGDACRAIGAEQRERIARMLCKGI